MRDEVAVTDSGAKYFNPEKMRYESEEYESCMMAMDDIGIPRVDDGGKELSLFGRCLAMAENVKNK